MGLGAVILACFSSGFAGVYFEKILKSMDSNLWIRNIQLGLFSLGFSLIACYAADGKAISEKGSFFYGYNRLVVVVILLQAAGGLVVALVMKHADNILKAFATSISIILSMIVSALWMGFQPTMFFLFGTVFVLLSVYMYGMPDGPAAAAASISTGGFRSADVDDGKKLTPIMSTGYHDSFHVRSRKEEQEGTLMGGGLIGSNGTEGISSPSLPLPVTSRNTRY